LAQDFPEQGRVLPGQVREGASEREDPCTLNRERCVPEREERAERA